MTSCTCSTRRITYEQVDVQETILPDVLKLAGRLELQEERKEKKKNRHPGLASIHPSIHGHRRPNSSSRTNVESSPTPSPSPVSCLPSFSNLPKGNRKARIQRVKTQWKEGKNSFSRIEASAPSPPPTIEYVHVLVRSKHNWVIYMYSTYLRQHDVDVDVDVDLI